MTKKVKDKIVNWEVYKRLKENIKPSFILVVIVILTSIVSIIYFIPKDAGSAGPDPATPLDGNSDQNITDAIASGATSYKLLVYDNRPQELADAIIAGKGKIAIALRGTGSLSGTDYANMLSTAFDIVQQKTGSLAAYVNTRTVFASCCENEPEYNEPTSAANAAANYSDFIAQLRQNNDLDKFNQAWYVADVANSNYISYLTQFLEFAGNSALEADFIPINCYQNCIQGYDALVQIYSAIFNNLQLFIYETAPWSDQGLSYQDLENFVHKCGASENCVDVLLFNALNANGQFAWHWDGISQDQILKLYTDSNFKFNNQGLKTTFYRYIQYLLTGDEAYREDYEKFVQLLANYTKYYQTLYKGSNELYGISSAATNVRCSNGQLTFDYAVNRSNPITTVADVSLGISYIVTNKDGSSSSGFLGGSSRYGGNLNRPGGSDGTTGSIITLSQGDNDGINHTVPYSPDATSIKIVTDLGFNSQHGFNHHVNECIVQVSNGVCSGVVCNGADPNSLYCTPRDDSVRHSPLKQPVDAEPVSACQSSKSTVSLSHKFHNGDEGQYRLGFEISDGKGAQIVAALIKKYPDAKLSNSVPYTDNTSNMIANNLSIAPFKTNMTGGYIDVSLNDTEAEIKYAPFLTSHDIDLTKTSGFTTDVSAGVNHLEYLFELICYLDSSQSPNQAPCNKILRDNEKPLTMNAYDDLSEYPFFADLRDQILSCSLDSNKQSYEGKNSDMYVGGSGSYFSAFTVTSTTLHPTGNPLHPTPSLVVNTKPDLLIQRINWIISSMLSDEKDFLTVNANDPALQKKLQETYQACMLEAGKKFGSAAEVNYRLVLEKRQKLDCPAGSIRMADYEWKRVAVSNSGTAYIPGLALVYEFMSQLPSDTNGLVPGMTFRFNPEAENPCAIILEK